MTLVVLLVCGAFFFLGAVSSLFYISEYKFKEYDQIIKGFLRHKNDNCPNCVTNYTRALKYIAKKEDE